MDGCKAIILNLEDGPVYCGRKLSANGLCFGHNKRKSRGMPVDVPLRSYITGPHKCTEEGCKNDARGTRCAMHESRYRRQLAKDRECSTQV